MLLLKFGNGAHSGSAWKLNGVKYIEILKDYVLPELEASTWPVVRFQHDNAPCHEAEILTNFLDEKRVDRLASLFPRLKPNREFIWNNEIEIVKTKGRCGF